MSACCLVLLPYSLLDNERLLSGLALACLHNEQDDEIFPDGTVRAIFFAYTFQKDFI